MRLTTWQPRPSGWRGAVAVSCLRETVHGCGCSAPRACSSQISAVEATHYRVRLDDAAIRRLGTLRPNQLSGFELESPGSIRSLDVWIADGYIRRLRVTHIHEAPGSSGTTVEFYDFDADITITPPT